MASFKDFAQAIKTVRFTGDGVGAEFASEQLAIFAQQQLAEVIANGSGTEIYDLFVNNRPAVSEFDVEMAGSIVYVFSWWEDIIQSALSALIAASPKKSGRFASSFVVLVNGQIVSPATPIASATEVIITNVQPYSRKIQVGAMQMSVPPEMFNRAASKLRRQHKAAGLVAQVKFLNLPRGIHPLVPYILKGAYAGKRSRWLTSAKAGTLAHGARKFYRRKDLDVGQAITYPTLVLNIGN